MQPGSHFSRTRTRALFCLLAAGLVLTGCGLERARTDDAASAAPNPPPARAVTRTLAVVALVDGTWQRIPRFETRVRRTVAEASRWLTGWFGVALELKAVAPWPTTATDATTMLAALEAEAPAPAADLVVAFTARPPPRRARMPDLALSRYAGRYAVLHGLGRYFPEAPGVQQAAETRALLHAVGRIFGALDGCEAGVMNSRPTTRMQNPLVWRWGPSNAALVEAHVGLPLSREGARVPEPVAEKARRLLMEPGPDLRCDLETVDRRRRLLADVMSAARKPVEPPSTEPLPELLDDDAPTDTVELDAVAAAMERIEADPAAALQTCAAIADATPAVGARCAGQASETLGRHEDAVRYYRAWLAHHPDDEQTLLRLAREVGRDGDDEAARALLARAVAEHPDFVEARLNLGIAEARLGRYVEARASWQAVLARAPGHPEARRLLEQLDAAGQ